MRTYPHVTAAMKSGLEARAASSLRHSASHAERGRPGSVTTTNSPALGVAAEECVHGASGVEVANTVATAGWRNDFHRFTAAAPAPLDEPAVQRHCSASPELAAQRDHTPPSSAAPVFAPPPAAGDLNQGVHAQAPLNCAASARGAHAPATPEVTGFTEP
ncbi:hypothetical protein EON68_02705 [archaeon]|nr:MAG: hypothetical protein EON68_02705 [archaeon]